MEFISVIIQNVSLVSQFDKSLR